MYYLACIILLLMSAKASEALRLRLQQLAAHFALSVSDLSLMSGLSYHRVQAMMQGRQVPVDRLVFGLLCQLPVVRMEWLLFGSGAMLRESPQSALHSRLEELLREGKAEEDAACPAPMTFVEVLHEVSGWSPGWQEALWQALRQASPAGREADDRA